MAQIVYVNWNELLYYDTRIKEYIHDYARSSLKFGGSFTFNKLPEPFQEFENYIYRVLEPFNTADKPEWFFMEGEFPANTVLQVAVVDNDARYVLFAESADNGINDAVLDELERIDNDIKKLSNKQTEINASVDKVSMQLLGKQDTLESGRNIVTINNQSLLGAGNITIETSSSTCKVDTPVAIKLGGFRVNDSLKDKSYDELFELLLCNTFRPKVPMRIDTQLVSSLPAIYVGDTTSPSFYSKLADVCYTESNASRIDPNLDCVYQINNNGVISEYGYQVTLYGSGRFNYSIIYIPAGYRIDEIKLYDALSAAWIPYNGEFSKVGASVNIDIVSYNQYVDSISNNLGAALHYRIKLIKEVSG